MAIAPLPEHAITAALVRHLTARGWSIPHYHPPGGHASFPIHLSSGDTIYLDIVAVRGSIVVAIENKPSLNSDDIHKLVALAGDPPAVEQVLDATWRFLTTHKIASVPPAELIVAHGFSSPAAPLPHDSVYLLHVDRSRHVTAHSPHNGSDHLL